MQSAVLAIALISPSVSLSVCPSIRPSVTDCYSHCVYCAYDPDFANVVHLYRQPTQVGVHATWLRSALGSS